MNKKKRPSIAEGAHEGDRGLEVVRDGDILSDLAGGLSVVREFKPNCVDEFVPDSFEGFSGSRAHVFMAERVGDGAASVVGRVEQGDGIGHLVSSSALAAIQASQFVTLRFWRAASASMAAQRLGVKRMDFATGALGEVGNELTILVANLDEELTGVVGNHGVGPIVVGVRGNRGLSSGSRGVEANGGTGQNHLGNSYNLIPVRYQPDTNNATKVKTSLKESWEAA